MVMYRQMVRSHPVSVYAKYSEKLIFLTPRYAHVRVRIKGLEMLVFWKILRTHLMDDPCLIFCGNSLFIIWHIFVEYFHFDLLRRL